MKSQEGSKPAERLNGSEILERALAEEGWAGRRRRDPLAHEPRRVLSRRQRAEYF